MLTRPVRVYFNEFSSICSVLITVMEIEKDTSLPDNLRSALSNLTAKDGPVANLLLELKNILPNEQAWESGKMKTISRLTWPFKEKEAGAIIDRLKNYCGEITNILVIDTWNTLKEVKLEVQQVNQKPQEVDLGVQEGNRGVKELKRDSAAQKRNLETGRWIFHVDQSLTLATAGHGKTILASAIIDEVQGEGKATLAYFYCNFRDDRTTIAAAILRSLIVQLLRQSKDDWITKIGKQEELNAEGDLDSLRKLWKQKSNGEQHPTDLGYLRKLLVEILSIEDLLVFSHL
ncbi:hypothetical protein EDB19DRAFT_1837580 [Suillus lakei]|nr:hypothetical protein EDB19DRAFT_1837580 [Suillus lakei]